MIKIILLLQTFLLVVQANAFSSALKTGDAWEYSCPNVSSSLERYYDKKTNDYFLLGNKNFQTDYPAKNKDNSVNVVVEIPAGCNDKWEVNKEGNLFWDKKKSKVKFVKYLSYPGNYGMIPQTLLPKEEGGDGDPLDILVIGPTLPRGSVVKARMVGVIRALDDGERDDKLIAVWTEKSPNNPFQDITKLSQLPKSAVKIISKFFKNYKGKKKMKILGVENQDQANKIFKYAATAYKKVPGH